MKDNTMTQFEIKDNEILTGSEAANDYLSDMFAIISNESFRLEAAKLVDGIGVWSNKFHGEDKIHVYMWVYVELRRQERLYGVDILERFR